MKEQIVEASRMKGLTTKSEGSDEGWVIDYNESIENFEDEMGDGRCEEAGTR